MGVATDVRLDVSNNGWKGYLPSAKVTTLYKRENSKVAAAKAAARAARKARKAQEA
jgi:hypothetical protein